MKRLSRFKCTFILLALSLSACSSALFQPKNTVLTTTLVNVSSEYLSTIIRGDISRLSAQVIWGEYIASKGAGFSEKEFASQLSLLDRRWTKDEHPLVNLDILEVHQDESHAEIVLRRIDDKASPKIKLEMNWTGGGWQISRDNLFGPKGLFSELKPLSVSEKKRPKVIKHISSFHR